MGFAVQASLWSINPDGPSDRLRFAELGDAERIELELGAWIDVRRSWMINGLTFFEELLVAQGWRSERRPMYDRVVDVPRLLQVYGTGKAVPWPELVEARSRLSTHYLPELGEPLTSTGLCLYRDGTDSVAWHGDTIGRGGTHDTVVAIVSLGATRTLALRPRNGGASLRFALDHGDLLVMGGSCQRTWEHAVPKTARAVGPRVSVQFRAAGVS
jgi:alkylated DNA repair dioxygenase AlkB